MKKLDARNLIVLEKDGVSGLTVGSKSLKPGLCFSENDWPYGEESLKNAIKNKRCKFVEEEKEEIKDEKVNKKEIKKRIKELEKEYSTIEDSESEEAKDILSIIEDLEEELK